VVRPAGELVPSHGAPATEALEGEDELPRRLHRGERGAGQALPWRSCDRRTRVGAGRACCPAGHPAFTRDGQDGVMGPLRYAPARLLGPLVGSSALLSACAAGPHGPVGPSAGPPHPLPRRPGCRSSPTPLCPPCSPSARPTGGSNRWPSRPTGGRNNAAPQSPLTDPDTKDGKAFRAVRVLAGDTATGQPTAEYVYPLEDVASFDPGAKGDQSEIKISPAGLVPAGLLVGPGRAA